MNTQDAIIILADQPSWGVVHTRSNEEALAERSLRAIGYEPLVVRYHKLIRGSRTGADGRRIRSRKDELQPRPFIPGYLFLPVIQGDDATLVDHQPGVRRLFRSRTPDGNLGKPKLIRARLVIQLAEAAKAADETPTKARADIRQKLDAGEKVCFRHPSLGITAVLLTMDERGRALWFSEQLLGGTRGSIENTADLELVDA